MDIDSELRYILGVTDIGFPFSLGFFSVSGQQGHAEKDEVILPVMVLIILTNPENRAVHTLTAPCDTLTPQQTWLNRSFL